MSAIRWPPGARRSTDSPTPRRRVVNLFLAGQFGARCAPVGLAAGPWAALAAGLPLVLRPRLAALFALATELRARQGLNLRAQVVTLALDLLQLLAQGFAPGLQPAVLDPQDAIVLRLRVSTPMSARRSQDDRPPSADATHPRTHRASPSLPPAPPRARSGLDPTALSSTAPRSAPEPSPV